MEIGDIAPKKVLNSKKLDSSDQIDQNIQKSMSALVDDDSNDDDNEDSNQISIISQLKKLEDQRINGKNKSYWRPNYMGSKYNPGTFIEDPVWLNEPDKEDSREEDDERSDDEEKKAAILAANQKKKNMKMLYKKGDAKSEDKSFQSLYRHPILSLEGPNSLIEEENKTKSNLNLSTSSRSYKPGMMKAKSMHGNAANPTIHQPYAGKYTSPTTLTSPPIQQQFPYNSTNVGYVQPNAMMGNEMMMHQIQAGIPPQYAYPMSMMLHPPGFSSQHMGMYNTMGPPAPLQPDFKSNSINSTAGSSPNHLTTSLVMPTTMPATSSSTTSKPPQFSSVIPGAEFKQISEAEQQAMPIGPIKITTGLLKFFNQQHQYGFIISEVDKLDVFFHYDDVKHTLLSKGKILNAFPV